MEVMEGDSFLTLIPPEVLQLILLSIFPCRSIIVRRQLKDLATLCLICTTFRDIVYQNTIKNVEHISRKLVPKLGKHITKFSGLRKLKTIDLQQGVLFGEFPNIQKLVIDGYFRVNRIEVCLSKLTQLSSLFISSNYIERDTLMNLSGLTRLYILRDLGNIKLGEYFQYLPNLTSFGIPCNKNAVTDDDLGNLTNLKELDITHNRIITDGGLSKLTSLTVLKIEGTGISDEGISRLTSLITLDIASNDEITERGIRPLVNLEILKLDDTNSFSVIQEAGNMTRLKELSIDYSTITGIYGDVLDTSLSRLSNLTKLDVYCRMKTHDICTLTKLTSLSVCNSDVEDLVLTDLKNLTILDIRATSISSDCIKSLTSLIHLYTNKEVEYDIYAKFPNLKTLISPMNIMNKLSLNPITSLTDLTFSCNEVLEIHHFSGLPHLKKLSIGDCCILPISDELCEYLDRNYVNHGYGISCI